MEYYMESLIYLSQTVVRCLFLLCNGGLITLNTELVDQGLPIIEGIEDDTISEVSGTGRHRETAGGEEKSDSSEGEESSESLEGQEASDGSGEEGVSNFSQEEEVPVSEYRRNKFNLLSEEQREQVSDSPEMSLGLVHVMLI
jgi:hypothetical protein